MSQIQMATIFFSRLHIKKIYPSDFLFKYKFKKKITWINFSVLNKK